MGTRSGGRTPTGPHWTRRALLQRTGTVTLPLEPAEPGEPGVEAYTFSYEFQDEPEGAQETKKSSLGAGSQKNLVGGAPKHAAKPPASAGKEGNARDGAAKKKDAKKK